MNTRSRTFPASLAVSVATHALVFVYLARHEPAPALARDTSIELERIDARGTKESEWIDVEWIGATIPEPTSALEEATATRNDIAPEARPARAASSIERTRETAASAVQPPEERATTLPPEHATQLAMRTTRPDGTMRATQPDTRVPGSGSSEPSAAVALFDRKRVASAITAARDTGPPGPRPLDPLAPTPPSLPRGLNKVPDGPRSELRPDGGGTYRANDLTFTAKIDRNGRVTLEDKPDFHFNIGVPDLDAIRKGIGRGIEQWYDLPYEAKRGVDTPALGGGGGGGGGGGNGGSVGIAAVNTDDWLMRKLGVDPYLARKRAFYDRTRDERAGIAKTENSRVMAEALATLPRQLVAIWANDRWSLAQRRRVLFQLWDDCAETGTSEIVEAGNQARELIIAFIQLRLPEGSPHAYSARELRALDRVRQSRQRFEPYRQAASR